MHALISVIRNTGPLGDLVVIGKHASKRMQEWGGTDTGGEIVFGDEGPFEDEDEDEVLSATPRVANNTNSPSRSPSVRFFFLLIFAGFV